MIYPQTRNIHRPEHLYIDDEFYFITSRTLNKRRYFKANLKYLVSQSIKLAKNKYHFQLFAWVVLENHYHLLIKLKNGGDLAKIVRYINGRSAKLLINIFNITDKTLMPDEAFGLVMGDKKITEKRITEPEAPSVRLRGPIWYQYREKVVYGERDFYSYFNYIHLNPVKHGLVKNRQELLNYPFCSYKLWLKKMGIDWLDEVIG